MADPDRPNPDQLLARVQAEEAKARRGKLKIFFGAAPGVGKTYAMLEAARKVAKEGVNVVVGYIEPHARPETQALVLGLDVLPKRTVNYRGRQLLELDLQAGLAAKPQLIVVDELAHTNAIDDEQPLVHAKRWQDVEALLAAGIDVYTTVNVQHLESLNDVVAKITGVIVRETLPDSVFEQAEEVELVDLPPDDLIGRLREGKVYVPGQAARALEHFFNKGNLIALRELALRKMAERVDRQMTDYRTDQAIEKTWPAAERLLVCVTPGPTSPSLVRATRRMAASLRAPWIAVHVETPTDARLRPSDRERLAETLQLARRLGGEVVTLGGADSVGEIVAYARQHNVTKIIVGKTLHSRWRELIRGSFIYDLARRCGDIDVYVISGESTAATRHPAGDERPVRLAGYGAALVAIVVATGLCWAIFPFVSTVTLCMIYLAGVVAVATWHGRGPSILASFLGVLAFNFFFIHPYYTFAVSDTQYIFTFVVMLLTGLLISTLTGRLTFQASLARRRELEAAELSELSRALVQIDRLPHLERVRERLQRLVCGQVFPLVAVKAASKTQSRLEPIRVSPGELTPHEQAVASWVADHACPAGLGTDTLPSVGLLFVPLVAAGEIVGVLGVRPAEEGRRFSPDQLRLIETVAGQLGLVVERIQSAELARENQLRYEREKLRSALLSAVSHDLRTPLAAIAGAGSTLAEAADDLHPDARRELAESIVAETDRLNRLIANLLDMTRLDAGSMQVDRDWHPMEDLIGGALHRLRRLLVKHQVTVEISPALGLVYVDELLLHQVLTNLLENALRFAPPGSEIKIAAGTIAGKLVLEVMDHGPGIEPGDEERIFEKFYRAPLQPPRSGTGLGLAICRGIVELHGGTIRAENRSGGGAVFRIELPQPPQPALPAEPPPQRAFSDAAK
ncbi:MAG TPA: sensor histidine kinase KdpD [Pirellulaceae bacterium]|nr:sensor histidine kinase KdpD [Pirellulaceae bacterium]